MKQKTFFAVSHSSQKNVCVTETTKDTTARANLPIPSHHGVGRTVSRVHRVCASFDGQQGFRLQDVDIHLATPDKVLGKNYSLSKVHAMDCEVRRRIQI